MRTTREEALQTLGLHDGATADDIRIHYKKLALRWHPDKNHGNKEATKKFQDVSAAYKKLTSDDDSDMMDDVIMSWDEMMQMFAQMFACRVSRHHHHHHHHHHHCFDDYDETYDGDFTDDEDDEDDDYYFTEDTEEDYDDDEFLDNIASRLRNKFEAKKYTGKVPTGDIRRPRTEEEALKNARELIEQEETEKQKEERKKAKRKKKKEKRKQREKEKKIQEEEEQKIKQEAILTSQKLQEKEQLTSVSTNKKRGDSLNGPIKIQNDSKVKEEKASHTQDKVNSLKNNRCPTTSNGNINSKKDYHKKKPNDHGSSDEEKIDTNSAFFARAASKAPATQTVNYTTTTPLINTKEVLESTKNIKKDTINMKKDNNINKNKNKEDKADEKPASMDPVVFKSRQNAVEGNRLAQNGDYNGAVKMFTDAIQLDPSDFRFFGNRSFCCDRLGQFERALKDANEAVSLAPEWPKGYFRMGRALNGLKRYEEAEKAFQDVLKLDSNCEDAQFELARVRVQILINMGFDPPESAEAIKIFNTVQAACDALISGKVVLQPGDEELYFSDDDKKTLESTNNTKSINTPLTQIAKDTSTNSSENNSNYATHNGHLSDSGKFSSTGTKKTANGLSVENTQTQGRYSALWVGNVEPTLATEKTLSQLFSTCGKVTSVRILPSKYCAFVNYATVESAAAALEKLQGARFCDQNLLLRYPNNQPPPFSLTKQTQNITNGQRQLLTTKINTPAVGVTLSSKSMQKALLDSKVTGPVNGNECYFWRTTGCVFNDRCRYDHFPDSKGVDLNKVKAKYGKGGM